MLWLMMLTGAAVLTAGCVILAQGRRDEARVVTVRDRRSGTGR